MSALEPFTDPPRAQWPGALRHPFVVLAYAAYLLVAGLVVAAPWAAILHEPVAGYPRGEAELFDAGGVMLVEALRLVPRAAPAALTSSGLVVVLATALGLFPFAMLIAALGRQGGVRPPFLAARAADSIGTLTLIWGLGSAAQATVFVLVALLGGKFIDALHLTARGEAIAQLGLGVAMLLAALPFGVARDLAAVSAVDDRTRLYDSMARGLRVLGRAPGRAIGGYFVRTLGGLVVLLAAFAFPALVRGPGAEPAVVIPFAVHQLAIVVAVFLRASWLAAAIRVLGDRAPLPSA